MQQVCFHLGCNLHLPVIHQNDQPREKAEAPAIGLQAFRKCRVVPLATYMQMHKHGDTADIKGMGTAQKGMPHHVTTAKPEESTASSRMLLALL